MAIFIGKRIKEVYEVQGIKLTDFARQIGTVRQNVYRIFERESVDTNLLLRVSEILNYNFFQYYQPKVSDTLPQKQDEDLSNFKIENEQLRKELSQIQNENAYLKKIIYLMEERAAMLKQEIQK